MTSLKSVDFARSLADSPVTESERAALLAGAGFGEVFTEHMVTVPWAPERGWHDARVERFGPLSLSPAAAVLHYGQEIFEGMKAYRAADGGVNLFRVDRNAARFAGSARRLAMPEVPAGLFRQAIEELVRADEPWLSGDPQGTLYLRPFEIASEPSLGMRAAARYLFGVIACPVAVPRDGAPPMRILVTDDYVRAVRGGTGDVKCGGNYAGGMPALAQAAAAGFDQVLFLDAVSRRCVEELGGMNVFLVYDDGSLVTPPLTGTILPGVTRDSVIRLAAERGLRVEERPIPIEDWLRDARDGRLTEAFACGTVAAVRAIGTLRRRDTEVVMAGGATGPVTTALRRDLLDIQHGRAADQHGWITRVVVGHDPGNPIPGGAER